MHWRGFYVKGVCVLVVVVLALSLTAAGCGMLARRTVENATGGQAQVNQNNGGVTVKNGQGTFQAGSTYQWPSQLPPDVPKFTYGTITDVIQSNTGNSKGTSIGIQNVTPDAFDKYQNDLKNAGWAIETTSQSADGFLISATKDKRSVMASFSNSSDTGLSGEVIYTEGQ